MSPSTKLYLMATVAIPWWMATEALAGRWSFRRVNLRAAWRALVSK